ncbi:hypothetical protein VTO42DRAFT_1615 [Malbranchea cinnamomea]
MLHLQLCRRRIPRIFRPSKPPSKYASSTTPRFFSTSSQFLLSHPPVRPQLPFLHNPSAVLPRPFPLRQPIPGPPGSGPVPVSRLISTERRKKITEGIKVALVCYAMVMMFYAIKEGLYQQKAERMFPTPPDWSFWSRLNLRSARALQSPERMGLVATDWVAVGFYYKELLDRLEDEAIDGKGLVKVVDTGDTGIGEALVVDGVGQVGYDVTGMTEPWKKGYFEALMGAAEAAEKLEGWVFDPKRKVATPAEYMITPANVNNPPRPPPGRKVSDLPREEDSVPAFPSPEVFYLKILTTKGFRTNQKLDAALAYADWLDYKGLKDTAGDMYKWAMDIAASGLSVDPDRVVDVKTGILKQQGHQHVSDNLLRASTALGVHEVRRGDLAKALSIFLSVLRARRNLPQPPATSSRNEHEVSRKPPPGSQLSETISSFFFDQPYPIPTYTGDETPMRTHASVCEEAGLMVYIGEIIYASSSQEHGLSWTRDAVDAAELSILQLADDPDTDENGQPRRVSFGMQYATPQERCRDCLKTGLDNWKKMVRKLVVKAENEELEAMDRAKDEPWWRFGWGQRTVKEKMMNRRRWEAEEMILKERSRLVARLIGDPGLTGLTSGPAVLLR